MKKLTPFVTTVHKAITFSEEKIRQNEKVEITYIPISPEKIKAALVSEYGSVSKIQVNKSKEQITFLNSSGEAITLNSNKSAEVIAKHLKKNNEISCDVSDQEQTHLKVVGYLQRAIDLLGKEGFDKIESSEKTITRGQGLISLESELFQKYRISIHFKKPLKALDGDRSTIYMSIPIASKIVEAQ